MFNANSITRSVVRLYNNHVQLCGIVGGIGLMCSGCFGVTGAVTAALVQKEEPSDNPPQVQRVAVSSPTRVLSRSGGLVGRVVVDYTISDKEGHNVDMVIQVSFEDSGGKQVELSTLDRTLSESIGNPSEGTDALQTSPKGTPHRFVWNSDYDIDRLVREGRLETPIVARLRFSLIAIQSNAPHKKGEINVTISEHLNNRLVHTVAGIAPVTGKLSVPLNEAVFDTLTAMDFGEGERLYFADGGTHQVWTMKLEDKEVQLFAGRGIRRGDKNEEPPEEFDGVLATDGVLSNPIDIVVDTAEERDIVYIVEDTGVLWRVDREILTVMYDGGAISSAQALAVDRDSLTGRRVAYIADRATGQVVRCELDSESVAPDVDGGSDDPPVCTMPFRVSSVSGVLLYHNNDGTRSLLVSNRDVSTIVRIDNPGCGADKNLPIIDVLGPGDFEELCWPTALRVIGQELFISCIGTRFDGNKSKGIVIAVPIRDAAAFELDTNSAKRVAGGLGATSFTCKASEDFSSTYHSGDECGIATEVPLSNPSDVLKDREGGLYISDSRNRRIRRISDEEDQCKESGLAVPGQMFINTFVGGAADGSLEPKVVLNDICVVVKDEIPAVKCTLSEPLGMTLIDDKFIVLCDRGTNRVLRLNMATSTIGTICGQAPGEEMQGVEFAGDGGPATEAVLNVPRSVAAFPTKGFCGSSDKRLYIADSNNNRIRCIGNDGKINTVVGGGSKTLGVDPEVPTEVFLEPPRAVITDSRGRLLITTCDSILLLDSGELRRIIGTDVMVSEETCLEREGRIVAPINTLEAQLRQPSEMAFDSRERRLYFTGLRNRQVMYVDYDVFSGECIGQVQVVAGTGMKPGEGHEFVDGEKAINTLLGSPFGVTIDPTDRFLYVSDVFNANSIYRIDLAEEIIQLVAGGNQEGAAGDGDDPLNAEFVNINVIKLDSSGSTLYAVDGRNNRIRRFFIGGR